MGVVLSRSSGHKNSNSKNSGENMRIADVLCDRSDDDDGGEVEVGGSGMKRWGLDSSSSRSLISRWLPTNYSFKITKRKKKGADAGPCVVDPPAGSGEVAVDPPAGSGVVAVDPPSDSEARRSSELAVDSGRKHEDFSFRIGMGIGLVFFLARSAAEFNKITELRAEMEMMLKEIKHEVRRKDATASSSESNNDISFSPSRCCGDINASQTTSMPNCSAFFDLQEAKCDVEADRQSKYDTAFANTRSVSIDQMEAELEVELERMQHNLEGEGFSTLQQRMEVDCESHDSSFESFSINCEEEINALENASHENHGVCAHELERKLHELLEMRQQEKIEELESALECTEKRLRDKEMELELWKETHWVALREKEEVFI